MVIRAHLSKAQTKSLATKSMPDPAAQSLAEFIRSCPVPVTFVKGKIQTSRKLQVSVPQEFIPPWVLELKKSYDEGNVRREENVARWQNVRRKLARYSLLDYPIKRNLPLTNAEMCHRWRHRKKQQLAQQSQQSPAPEGAGMLDPTRLSDIAANPTPAKCEVVRCRDCPGLEPS